MVTADIIDDDGGLWDRMHQTTLLLRDSLSLSRSFLLWPQPWLKSIDYNVAMTFIKNNNHRQRSSAALL